MIIKDKQKIKEFVKKGYSTRQIATFFQVSQRTVQVWLRELGINRSLKEAKRAQRINGIKNNEEINEDNTYYLKRREAKSPKIEGEYALYRFLNEDEKVIYLGKCIKSIHNSGHRSKNGIKGKKIYFLKERITQHFAPTSKHLPQKVYRDTKKIEYLLLNSKDEVEIMEQDLILKYKYMGQCLWNGQTSLNIIDKYNTDNLEWKIYKELY